MDHKIRTDRRLLLSVDILEILILSVWVPLTEYQSGRWYDPAFDTQTVLLNSLLAIPVTTDYFEAHMQHS